MNFRMLVMLTNVLLVTSSFAVADERTVNSNGKTFIKQMPTTVKMLLQFKESGKDVTAAIKNLKDRREAAKEKLVKFGSKADTMREGAPSIATEDPQAAMMAMRMGARGRKSKKKTASKQVTVTGTLSCEWTIPAGKPDEILTFVQDLKDKVTSADLAAQKEEKKLPAEEQEEMEEMEMMQQQFGSQNEVKAGEPMFMYIAKISAKEQQDARKSAFQKAQSQAEQLAVAAGKKLGKLRTIQASEDSAFNSHYMAYGRYGNGNEESMQEFAEDGDGDADTTGVSPNFTKISFVFTVNATFDLEE